MKPSQAALLQEASAVFWVGPELAPALAKPIESMADDAVVVEFMESAGIHHLDIREGTSFDSHDHDHGDEHEEAHGEHEGEETHEEHAAHEYHEDDAHEAGHEHVEAHDPHLWLNPENGIAIAGVMAETLAELDPGNAATYRENAAKFTSRIETLEQEIRAELEPLSDKKFVVFHDAYHHFEHHFEIEASGSVTVSPEALSSADRVAAIQDRIKELGVVCVFQEPQFDAKLVDVVLEGSNARKGTLDPLGTDLANGPDLYPQLLENLSGSLAACLNGQS
ncbi:zinc ABC transporter substrate-binding protein [Roseibium salinum]|uniref:High-affinity zinc uptake system protein ZnuA n=1 Tax=Roseibium salinum TaxID=1604349 RepID=A0ABT3R0U0_9HYPH|nr:zinc ABC transporter substrate-binding protein [Roseibium sp. DSM 29163]MCX2722777.1 zinc ABC transporter substrate-binding protein [Roseibium sp. DSM 29163]